MGINIFDPNMAGTDGLAANQQGGMSQASVGGINLESGMPLYNNSGTLQGANIPQSFQALSAMNGGIVGNGAQPEIGAGGMSASDQFFNSAPTPSRVVSTRPNGANAGANYNTGVLNNLMASYKTASAKAQADQLAQYQQLMQGVTGYTKNINALSDQVGAGNQQLIARQGANTKGQAEQDLISRGLGNTTIRSSVLAGVDKNTALAQAQNASSVAQQKIGTQMGLSQMYGDALLSKNVQGPGNEYLSLISQLANRG